MPVDPSGNATRPTSPIPVTGQTADAPQINVAVDDIYAILNMLEFSDGRKSRRGPIAMNGYRAAGAANAVDPQDYVTLSQVQSLIAAVQGVPTGAMIAMTGAVVPAAWVIANGQTLLRATYPAFWAWVQTSGNLAATEVAKTFGQYGPGDGSSTFTVPNLYADGGYFIRPLASGRTIGSVQADEVKAHDHAATFSGNPVPPHDHNAAGVPGGPGNAFGGGVAGISAALTTANGGHTPTGTVSVSASGGSETRPRNIAYPVLIKT